MELVLGSELHLTDCKVPVVLTIDNTICLRDVRAVQLELSRQVALRENKLEGQLLYMKRVTIAKTREELRIPNGRKEEGLILSLPLLSGKDSLLVCPMIYSKHIFCEYKLRCTLEYASGCCLCVNNGPELDIMVPVVEGAKAPRSQQKDATNVSDVKTEVVDPNVVQLVVNAAKAVDPHMVMKSKLPA